MLAIIMHVKIRAVWLSATLDYLRLMFRPVPRVAVWLEVSLLLLAALFGLAVPPVVAGQSVYVGLAISIGLLLVLSVVAGIKLAYVQYAGGRNLEPHDHERSQAAADTLVEALGELRSTIGGSEAWPDVVDEVWAAWWPIYDLRAPVLIDLRAWECTRRFHAALRAFVYDRTTLLRPDEAQEDALIVAARYRLGEMAGVVVENLNRHRRGEAPTECCELPEDTAAVWHFFEQPPGDFDGFSASVG